MASWRANKRAALRAGLVLLAALPFGCRLFGDPAGDRNAAYTPTSAAPAPPGTSLYLGDVTHWLYLLDVELDSQLVAQIAASQYDLVVVDFVPSQQDEADFPMAHVVAQLHSAPEPKLVLAYISVGEAEDYRTYWQAGWRVGAPEWIAGDDPDSWEGNFPVAYWHEGWRGIWLGSGGYLEAIVEAGFDGIYLDWVEACWEESVVALAAARGVDPVDEMVAWVADIAAFCRTLRDGFLVVPQNGAELAQREDYLAIIDGLAQEHVWFDGGEDNDPPGDCPLPGTPDDAIGDAYRLSLPPACRRAYDADPEATLHTSSQEYLDCLIPLHSAGLVILTVDYALDPDNVARAREMSAGLGFVPFVASRALDGYIEPAP
jgi:cysteinyl-tRNA synthetase